MKIMFIYSLEDTQSLSKPIRTWAHFQFGISYISSVLKANKYQTRLLIFGSNNKWSGNKKLLDESISNFSPDIICFTSVASQYPFIKKIADVIKNLYPDIYLIIGGVHATLNPHEVISGPFNAVNIGEGEYSVLELCRRLDKKKNLQGIKNLWVKLPDGTIEKNETSPFLQDIDNLPFPDREMWIPWIKEQRGTELTVLLGRGCPYNCSYCCNHAIKKVAAGKYIRFRSPENIIKEIAQLHKTFPNHSGIYFEVESIALNKTWLFELCKQLEKYNSTINNFLSYGCNFRITPQTKDDKIFIALRKANFHKINIGLESGSEYIRSKILNRRYSNSDFLNVVKMARKAGLKISVFNMIGLPKETYENHMETVSLNRHCQPDNHYTGIFYPYPGTKLFELCMEEGYINGIITTKNERKEPVIESSSFSKKKIKNAYILFDYRVYKGYKPYWWIIPKIVVAKIQSDIFIYSLFRKVMQIPGINYLREKLTKF